MKKMFGLFMITFLLLTGCTFGDSTEQQLSEVLQAMHDAEEGYRSVQGDLNSIEQSEYKLFEEILALEQQQQDVLQEKVTELNDLADERKELLATEKASMEEAYEAKDFSQLEIEEEHQTYIDDISAAYDTRYASYGEVYSNYEELLEIQSSLYSEMIKEDVSIDVIREKIQQVNAQNEKVQQTVSAMNTATEEFNSVTEKVFEALRSEE